MKKYFNFTPILGMLLFLLMSGIAVAQTTEVITLSVDTNNMDAQTPPAEATNYCDFGQDKSQMSNEDFFTEIDLGTTVEWRGVAENGTDIVHIDRIVHIQGPNPFQGAQFEEGQGPNGGRVLRITPMEVTTADPANDRGKYKIFFSIVKGGNEIDNPFFIDPILRVK